mmetsp:Transcript_15225/g.37560  ORF Transcript_15225/g.37560 Transcript_15225/m.37560 type:complete len:974 (+) Transcript_15225:286-3207(+)
MMDGNTTSGNGSSSSNNSNMGSGSSYYGGRCGNNVLVRGTLTYCLQIWSLADVLFPSTSLMYPIVTSGKWSFLVFLAVNTVLLLLWLPFWILSFFVGEWGIYTLAVGTVFLVGRVIIRLIAFPGSSHRVSGEIEKEFAKYSVRMISSSANSLEDLAVAVLGSSKEGTSGSNQPPPQSYEIMSLWKRAKSYRDRVLGVYAEVLHYTLQDNRPIQSPSSNSSHSSSGDASLNKYGNNVLVGDVGDLSGLTFEAKADGRVLLQHLEKTLTQLYALEMQAKPLLEGSTTGGGSSSQKLSVSARQAATGLMISAGELQEYCESLGLQTSSSGVDTSASTMDGDDSEDLTVDEMRRRFEEQNGSIFDTIKSGIASLLPMLDPPLHTSIFGFDVLRGCVLSRYRGARQIWVQRSSGGMVDVLHFPSKPTPGSTTPSSATRNTKAVLYCNPNAGLIEVATGISLAGGNVTAETEGVINDNCWTDFYTNLGYDVYLFNYAGFGRSFGAGLCGIGKRGGEERHVKGVWGRIRRILHGTFCSFRPTPDTLRADGVAVSNQIVSQLGVDSLVIHGESIGGVAASGTARRLSENNPLREKVSLLICDRTFCNLEAVAQRLVGGWSGYAIRMLAPFWSTDVVGDYLAANCSKVVATDSADVIIADSSSLKSGAALWKEIRRGSSSTRGVGWITAAPLHYRMADWENVCVTDSRYVPLGVARTTPPVWPSDKHISVEEGFHFAACAKRIGKLASIEKKRFMMSVSAVVDAEGGLMDSCQAPVFLVWKYLGCSEGLCGSALGIAVKGGFDTTVAWLCNTLTFGGQTVVEAMEHRHKWSDEEAYSKLSELGGAEPSDFDCRPPGYEKQESETVVHPKPIPEVVSALKSLTEEYANDEMMNVVSHELSFVIGTLEYVQARLSSQSAIETNWKNRHLRSEGPMSVGSFMNLHCGHNNAFSESERKRLKALVMQATSPNSTPTSSQSTQIDEC